jgi:hypothetical protein
MIRTVMVIVGMAVAYPYLLFSTAFWARDMFFSGMGLVVWGCYLWAKLKGRSAAWMLLGFFAPAGLVGLLILPVKAPSDSTSRPPSPPPRGIG